MLASPAAARGNTTSGIYPGTIKDVCVGDTIFVKETGLNLTPLTPYANGVVTFLRQYTNDNPNLPETWEIPVSNSIGFDADPNLVKHYYGIYYPVANGQVLQAYPIQIQPTKAGYPQDVVITSSRDWVVANGVDSALLTVTVTDGKNDRVSGADLVLSVSAPWGLQDVALTTDSSGKAQTLFLPTTKSGAAVITASAAVQGVTTAPVTNASVQNIDADTPYSQSALYPSTATVASPTTISVRVMDRYGNPVTSRRAVKNVRFFTTTSGTSVFLDGMGNHPKAISVPLNETGYATATFLVGTKQGNNYVSINPPPPLSSSIISIVGIGDSKPFSISQVVNPAGNPPLVNADGSSQATIDYYLLDQWGNPSIEQGIKITTSAGENRIFNTNQEGRATILYGKKTNAGFYYITASAEDNSSVRISQTLQFVSMDPKDMLLTATPQTMASLDVNPKMTASVIAKVIDEKGNPVKGQTVTFSIEKSDSAPYARTSDPAIGSGGVTTKVIGAPVPVLTDEDGQAILDYYPGAFPTQLQTGWNEQAQGTTIVNATWAGKGAPVLRNISLNYKNYPFISVYAEVSPKTVMTGGQVNVSVRLVGDGWALQIKPIDVVLCTDRSATMLNNESVINLQPNSNVGTLSRESYDDRMVDAMNAANAFVSKTSDQDRIGLVTFGDPTNGTALLYPPEDVNISAFAWRAGKDYDCKLGKACHNVTNQYSYDDQAYVLAHYPGHGPRGRDYNVNGVSTGVYVDSPLTLDKTQIRNAINLTVPAGGTPMRRAIYESVKQILDASPKREGAVQAIILLTDGEYTGGDPRGVNSSEWLDGLEKSMGNGYASVIDYAKNNNIKIFTVALQGNDTSNEPNLNELQGYATDTGGKAYVANSGNDLAQIYIDIAGKLREDASVNTQMNLDFKSMEVNGTPGIPGKTVFDYIPPSRSSFIAPPKPAVQGSIDNTLDWANNGTFQFSPGTIKVNQTWMVNFTLRALIEGNIRVLSKSSKVTFNGTEGEVAVPDTYVTAVPFGTDKGPEGIQCSVNGFLRTNQASDTQIAQLAWNQVYNGNSSKLTWEVWLAPPYSSAYQYKDTFNWSADPDQNPVTYNLLIRDLKPGTYNVKVTGHANDVSEDCWNIKSITILGPTVTAHIRIGDRDSLSPTSSQ